jgi:hypothetical protein
MTGPLLSRYFAGKDSRYLVALAELAIPPLSLLVMLFFLATSSALALLSGPWVALACSLWMVLFLYVISGQIQRRAPLATWLYLASSPFYVAWKIPLYAAMLIRKKSASWIRTARESEKTA